MPKEWSFIKICSCSKISEEAKGAVNIDKLFQEAFAIIKEEIEFFHGDIKQQLFLPLMGLLRSSGNRASSLSEYVFKYGLAFDNLILAHRNADLLEFFIGTEAEPSRKLLAAFRSCFVMSVFSTRPSTFAMILMCLNFRHFRQMIKSEESSSSRNAIFLPNCAMSNLSTALQLSSIAAISCTTHMIPKQSSIVAAKEESIAAARRNRRMGPPNM
ncbi:uncharacterized protein I206_105618 [Kwoniella pini CBS 10737]|uniref:Uncharacterized protein n=1 Tax=Kwoniella pini CBS 10737 TaxID=1296096 RepID=A0A1B9I3Q7_9TREE|nr:uncharacterized protein I206_03482 [Kwoniella pini CBS 10737]OCF50163.1 hypothetical protein I206_03482 [Kwoniella pini CBS 10737]